jgi:hypothetical protein
MQFRSKNSVYAEQFIEILSRLQPETNHPAQFVAKVCAVCDDLPPGTIYEGSCRTRNCIQIVSKDLQTLPRTWRQDQIRPRFSGSSHIT